jgi:phospholipid/cholesterol/gamma-HCH transport system substrate-binding protein
VPVIPTKPGALGELLTNAPQLIERLSTLTERLTELLNDQNQKSISGILKNVDTLTGTLAASGPDIRATIAETRTTMQKAGVAADELGKLIGTTNGMLEQDGKPMLADLRKTLQSASRSLDTLDKTIAEAQPGVRTFSRDTMPEMNLLVRDLREMSRSLRAITDKLDHEGAGSLIGSPALPDYKD